MRGYLRLLALLLLIGGLALCVGAAGMAIGDETFFKAGEALERHPDHVLFQGEYYAALIRHIAYIAVAILSGAVGIVGSAVLFGLYAVLRRLDRLDAARPVSTPAR
jgi:hypothetical protein